MTPHHWALLLLVMGSSIVIQLVIGVVASLRGDWMRVSIFFVGAALMAFYTMSGVLALTLNTHMERMEERFPDRPALRKISQRMGRFVGVFMVVLSTILFCLSIIAGWRQDWPRMSIYLVAMVLVAITCTTAVFVIGSAIRLKRLDELISVEKPQGPSHPPK